MIVVFVIDTSPSMGLTAPDATSREMSTASMGLSRLDLAKMAVESLSKGLNKRAMEHNGRLQAESASMQKSLHNLGLGYCATDQFLLLSTGRQYMDQPAAAACGAGGRLLVGYGDTIDPFANSDHQSDQPPPSQHGHGAFERELKRLRATVWQPSNSAPAVAQPQKTSFPEDGGGAAGLNIALSAGLQLLSRYRLKNRSTENFGMGRLPSPAMLTSGGGGIASSALQPACLVLITDGSCLRKPPSEGGGSLQLQFGNMPNRECYQEPFRWDQRIYCIGVGAQEGVSSTQYLHPSLRALCEVTGGGHCLLRSAASLSHVSDTFMKLIAPPRPRDMPIQDPLCPSNSHLVSSKPTPSTNSRFVNGGPVCCFQQLEGGMDGQPQPTHRAMLLYVPYTQIETPPGSSVTTPTIYQPPLWCIPESFFPSKKIDTLPPRSAQPLLNFSRQYQIIGSNVFDPVAVMKMLNRLDQLIISNRHATTGTAATGQPTTVKLLQRDVYVCEWLSQDCKGGNAPRTNVQREYLPVVVRGAARPSLSEGEENWLSVGILHLPQPNISLVTSTSTLPGPSTGKLSTLTLLPPEPHILLPLLLRAAEAEHRIIKRKSEKDRSGGTTAGLLQKQSGTGAGSGPRNVQLDEHWRSDFRAYMFRVPPYYQNALKRSLRPVIPTSVHSLLNTEGIEALASQCFSKLCLQKIRGGEQVSKDLNDRLERQEMELRRRGIQKLSSATDNKSGSPVIGYGQYDPRAITSSYLAALRNMPPPWNVGLASRVKENKSMNQDRTGDAVLNLSGGGEKQQTAVDILGDLPADCLLPYYESRRRWIFGGSGLSTRGIHVEGVNNDGSNVQYYGAKHTLDDDSLLSVAGIGASTLNKTTTVKMGDYRERLLWSRAPMVGYGANDSTGAAVTTAADGSPTWSVDDDAMPLSFFDPISGMFADSVQARVRSRLMVNFGNPYRDKRGNSLIPDAYLGQRPPLQQEACNDSNCSPLTPPGSPPPEAFAEVEGEGEAVFASPSRKHHVRASPIKDNLTKRDADYDADLVSGTKRHKKDEKRPTKVQDGVTESQEGILSEAKALVHHLKPDDLSAESGWKPIKVGNSSRPAPPRKPPPPPPSARKPPQPPPPPSEKRSFASNPSPPLAEKRAVQLSLSPKPSLISKPVGADKRVEPPPSEKRSSQPGNDSELTAIQQKGRDPPPQVRKVQPPPPPLTDLENSPQQVRKVQPPPPPLTDLESSPQQVRKVQPPPPPLTDLESSPQQVRKVQPPPPPLADLESSPQQVRKVQPPPPPLTDLESPPQQVRKVQPPPPPLTDLESSPPQVRKVQPPPLPPADLESPDRKPEIDLPPGWICVWSKSQKRWYFFDTKTNKSVWQWPPPGGIPR